jgi:metal-responsive CopG/Arc/MetJ family transcriptional regulator
MGELRKPETVTFKADKSLVEAMRGIANRSEFIREAILAALQSSCPLCQGTGTFTPQQMKHWREFTSAHRLAKCEQCHATHLVCAADSRSTSSHVHPEKASAAVSRQTMQAHE